MSELKIGDIIKTARINSGFNTKKDFSDVSGVSPATLSRIENNTQAPFPDTLLKISRHLKTVTYGELMKAAGYLDGMSNDQTTAVVDIFNENAELDIKIFNLLDKLSSFMNVDNELYLRIEELLTDQEATRTTKFDIEQLKIAYKYNDFDIEKKKKIITMLNDEFKKHSPKLVEYFSYNKNIKPIPLVGTICAGDGIIADEDIELYINYPFLNKSQPDFALKVKGDSMINAGIENGDIVFLRKANWAEYNGQVVAAIVNGEEASLKRLKWTEGSARFQLSPENDLYQSMEVTPNEVIICGVYAGHYRPEF